MARTQEDKVQDAKNDARQQKLEGQIKEIQRRLFKMSSLLFSVEDHHNLMTMPGPWTQKDLVWLQGLEERTEVRLRFLGLCQGMENFLRTFNG